MLPSRLDAGIYRIRPAFTIADQSGQQTSADVYPILALLSNVEKYKLIVFLTEQ